ncbi:MAG: VWA domain-containing protein [Phycisphaerales bacterium]|nr:VWA domain-containing protein [Phycisphaerales bacterium]
MSRSLNRRLALAAVMGAGLAAASLLPGCTNSYSVASYESTRPAPGLSYASSDLHSPSTRWSPTSTHHDYRYRQLPPSRDRYERVAEQPFARVTQQPLSTFAVDVDTGSYSNIRRFITDGELPPHSAVRVEEMINYFSYSDAPPSGGEPFAVHTEVASCPWTPEHRLMRVHLVGREADAAQRPPANLVFLLDVSGSMEPEDRLPLIKKGMRLLVDELRDDDRVAIVTYAGHSGVALPSTAVAHRGSILHTIDDLCARGSTNGASGIQLAYEVAEHNFIPGGINRVLLATDGDFNVGMTSDHALLDLIACKAQSKVYLTVLGVGRGNLNESMMESIADRGNGVYAYLDSFHEARRVLCEQAASTLETIAKDVKIQVEFNPAAVAGYRLIGYENRALADRDFNDDRKDAGDIGAGHSVTALYEIVPAGRPVPWGVDPLRYQRPAGEPEFVTSEQGLESGELCTVKLRYKQPDGVTSRYLEVPVRDGELDWRQASADFRWAAAVAAFGMTLRDSIGRGDADFDLALELAGEARGLDEAGYRAEFMSLVRSAQKLDRRYASSSHRD